MNELLPMLLPILLVVTALVVIGLWHASFLEVFRQLFVRPLHLLTGAQDVLRGARAALLGHAMTMRHDEGLSRTGLLIQRTFGAALFSALTLIFSVNDIHLANIFFEGRGFVGEATAWAAQATDWLDLNLIISMGIWSAYVLAGANLMDLLGVTHLMPQPSTRLHRSIAWSLAILVLLLALALSVAMGLDRGAEARDQPAMAAPEGSSMAALLDAPATAEAAPERPYFNEISFVVFIGHAGLMLLGTLISFTGLVQVPILAWLLLLVLPVATLSLLELPLRLLHALAEWLAGIGVSAVQFGLQLARLVASPFGRQLGPDWCETYLPVGAQAPWAEAAAEAAKGPSDARLAEPAAPNAGDPRARPGSTDRPPGAACAAEPAAPSRNWDPYGSPANFTNRTA